MSFSGFGWIIRKIFWMTGYKYKYYQDSSESDLCTGVPV